MVKTVGAATCWILVGLSLYLGRPDLAQPLAMLGTVGSPYEGEIWEVIGEQPKPSD